MAENGSAAGPGRSHYPVVDRGDRPEDPSLRSRRDAISELGDALRDLVQVAASTEVPEDVLRQAAVQVRQAAGALGGRVRARGDLPGADDLLGGYRMYNPVTGGGSPFAPPLRIEVVDGVVVGTCTLGLAFEGPPSFAHGGVSAMLLDQLLGYATSAAGHPGMTVALAMTYRAPVPLQTPLRLTSEVGEADGRRVTARGFIATEDQPGAVLVEAVGTFVGLRADQAQRLFGTVSADPLVARD